MKNKLKMKCPECKSTIDVDNILVTQFEDSIRDEMQAHFNEQAKELQKEKLHYNSLSKKLHEQKFNLEETVNERVKGIVAQKEKEIKASIVKQVHLETNIQLQALEKELQEKSAKIRDLNGTKAELEKLRRENAEAESRIIMEKEKELSERLEAAKLTIKEQAQRDSFLKLREREKVIEDLKLKLEDAKRKADQGSMQLQGEVQEREIIEILQEFHPGDDISQTKKGMTGADVLQIVRTSNGIECGKILYESKQTKSWSKDWVSKFKQDNISAKADILVLVSSALPKEVERYGLVDGVWVCGINDVKELSLVLRYGLLKLQQVAITQVGKNTKMEMLYKYLTSDDFKNVFQGILEGFRKIQESHQSEKLRMQRYWKEREKMLELVLSNSVDFYGSIKGIAGSSIPEIQMLSLKKAS
jgi:hypothetical protein